MRSLPLRHFQAALAVALVLMWLHTARSSPPRELRCAFTDERFSTWVSMATFIADYYRAHRVWPSTPAEIRVHAERVVAAEPAIAAKPTKSDFATFFARFSQVELTPRKGGLLVTLRFRAGGGVHTERVIFRPGRTTDDILQRITPQ